MDDNKNINVTDLVNKARLGCSESIASLALEAQSGLFTYIYRLTLNHDVAEDLRQEALLEMARSLKNLRNPERFWAWLYRTAWGKVQHYFRKQQHERAKLPRSMVDTEALPHRLSGSYGDGLKNLINEELSQAIVDSVTRSKLRHRSVIILRCCDRLPFSEIAQIMDCSEMAARVLFFRARQSLKQKLLKHGFSKGMIVGVLGLFGRMTAPADAACVTTSAASTQVGVTATLIGAAGTKLGLTVAALFTAAFLLIGSLVYLNTSENSLGLVGGWLSKRSGVKSFHYVRQAWDKSGSPNPNLARGRSLSKGAYEQWYYFPEGIDGAMFMMMQRWDPKLKSKLCGWLQNGSGNYYYHSGENQIYLYNCHLPMRYLNTRRLPSDASEFAPFLDQIEGESIGVDYTRDPKTDLLVGALDNQFYNAKNFQSSISYNTLDEKAFESFHYPWTEDAPVVDERDAMHQRGWTYFQITGQINGEQVDGYGRMPFIYDRYREQSPWFRLRVGEALEIVDSSSGAYVKGPSEKGVASYPVGSFFKGLARPWASMHAIDIIRRDAAEKRIEFKGGRRLAPLAL
jgi:RNA polymerase sigma-70 factor (ECF subfamily)